jgi:hypothetical protein
MNDPHDLSLKSPTIPVVRKEVHVSSEDILAAKRDFPWRSPLGLAEATQDIIRDKVVCDLGCGEGDQMREIQRYAKRVIGIEKTSRANLAEGLDVTLGDWTQFMPEAEVYHMWINPFVIYDAIEILQDRDCTLLAGGYRCESYMEDLAKKYDATVIEWAYDEPGGDDKERHAPWKFNYCWWAVVLEFNK